MGIPIVSSTSALPARLEIERFPCLTTRAPAAATTSAAAVDRFRLPEPSPPVPQVSTSGGPLEDTATGSASSRIAFAKPLTSAEDSPLVRRAASSAPPTAGGVPSVASARITDAASASLRSCPAMMASSVSFTGSPPRHPSRGSSAGADRPGESGSTRDETAPQGRHRSRGECP